MCFSVDVMCYYDWCNMNNVEKYTKQKCKLICWQVLETTNGDVTVHLTFNWNKCAVIDWQCAHNQEWVWNQLCNIPYAFYWFIIIIMHFKILENHFFDVFVQKMHHLFRTRFMQHAKPKWHYKHIPFLIYEVC